MAAPTAPSIVRSTPQAPKASTGPTAVGCLAVAGRRQAVLTVENPEPAMALANVPVTREFSPSPQGSCGVYPAPRCLK